MKRCGAALAIATSRLSLILWLAYTPLPAQIEAENRLRDPDARVRERAVRELGENNNPAYVSIVGGLVRDPDDKVRMTVVRALVRMGTEASLAPLSLAVRDGTPEIRYLAIDGIVNFYLPGYVDTGF